ncbi:putative Glutathione-dependent formaldehyde-activating enzyme [Seiridium unicorne]|uniref:Glutathione-dependent formaldehyde-activating enzyme n=1 Tax=Seiridium unicorne TaxID=138068 RepID=A0ABR2VCQ0_9PEZI
MSSAATGEKPSQTYECGCHCGYIKFSMTLSPPLTGQPEGENYKILQCNCSACTRFGYLLVYPKATEVSWHNDGRARCANYQFNTKQKDQMFCPKCGASLGIDFREVHKPQVYGISARTIYGINVDDLTYRKGNGMEKVLPAGDLSGHWWDEEKQEMK